MTETATPIAPYGDPTGRLEHVNTLRNMIVRHAKADEERFGRLLDTHDNAEDVTEGEDAALRAAHHAALYGYGLAAVLRFVFEQHGVGSVFNAAWIVEQIAEDGGEEPGELFTEAVDLGSLSADSGHSADLLPDEAHVATFEEFWRPLVTDKSGQLDLDKVARELHDYHGLLGEVPKVYDDLTGGRISKPNTAAHHVISEANDRAADYYARELCEHADTLDEGGPVSLALREVAEEWKPGAWQEWLEAKEQRARIVAAAAREPVVDRG